MGPLGRLVDILCAAVVIAGAIWGGHYSSRAVLSEARVKAEEGQKWEEQGRDLLRDAGDLKERERQRKVESQNREELKQREYRRPPIADKPPFPKILVDRFDCNLGTVDSEQTVRNTFKITNVGQARLVLVWHPTGCKQPASTFPRYQEIKPGESLDIEIRCALYGAIPNFRKAVPLWTNDPTRPDLDLHIRGTVVEAAQ